MEIITRAEARERGLTRFFTGLVCKHGHIVERYTRNAQCVECARLSDSRSYEKNKDRDRAAAKFYRETNAEAVRQSKARYALANREKVLAAKKAHRLTNIERYRIRNAEYRRANKEKVSARHVAYRRKLRESDPVFALAHRMRSLVAHGLRANGLSKRSKTAEIIGCTWPEFAAHIERQFLPGMTWENRALWHIDHIVPLATAVTEADVLALSRFTNLRPMWAADNLAKNSKITHLI